MKHLYIVIVLALLGGCTVQSTQLNAITSLFGTQPDIGEPWLLSYQGVESRVIPVAAESLTVFASTNDIAVAFDGWNIAAVVGFGPALRIKGSANDRVYTRGARTESHLCANWLKTVIESGSIWRQRCETEFSYENRITLDTQGRIILIDQVVDASGKRLSLKKL